MPLTTARIDMKDVYLYVLTHQAAHGGTYPTIISAGFKFSEGDFSYSAPREYEFIPDRGLIAGGSVRQADETPMEVNFEGEYATLHGNPGDPSAYEILMGEDNCAGWAGLGDNSCEPYATWLLLVNDPLIRLPACSEGEFLLFKNFFCQGPDVTIRAGTVNFNGQCKATAPEKTTFLLMDSNYGLAMEDIHNHAV